MTWRRIERVLYTVATFHRHVIYQRRPRDGYVSPDRKRPPSGDERIMEHGAGAWTATAKMRGKLPNMTAHARYHNSYNSQLTAQSIST